RTHEYAHGMGVVVETVHELLDVLMRQGVVHDLAVPVGQLFLGRQLPIQEQVGDFHRAWGRMGRCPEPRLPQPRGSPVHSGSLSPVGVAVSVSGPCAMPTWWE